MRQVKLNTYLNLHLTFIILFFTIGCNKEKIIQSTSDNTKIAKEIGNEFRQMISFSLTTSNANKSAPDIVEVKSRITEWSQAKGYDREGKEYYDAVMDLDPVNKLERKSATTDILSNTQAFAGYNQDQVKLIKDILTVAENSSLLKFESDIAGVEQQISKLPQKDQLDLLIMVEMIKGACDAINDSESTNSGNTLKAFGSFMCNLASGGIGTIYGAWAGGIAAAVFGATAIASGGISIAVGLVVGAAISTMAC